MCFDILFKFWLRNFSFFGELCKVLSEMYVGLRVRFLLLLSEFNEP
jgi:hypothetical protein